MENPPSIRSLLLKGVAVLVALPLVYVLSCGPAIFVAVKFPRTRDSISAYVVQLETMHNTALVSTVGAYCSWWLHLADSEKDSW